MGEGGAVVAMEKAKKDVQGVWWSWGGLDRGLPVYLCVVVVRGWIGWDGMGWDGAVWGDVGSSIEQRWQK